MTKATRRVKTECGSCKGTGRAPGAAADGQPTRRCGDCGGTKQIERFEPTVRVVLDDAGNEYLAELRDQSLTLRLKAERRPNGTMKVRRQSPAVVLTWGPLYERGLLTRSGVTAPAKTGRKRVTRGLLTT